MSRRTVTVRRFISAPPEEVFDLVADNSGWGRWAIGIESERECEGVDHPDGVGAIRKVGRAPVESREEITAFDPPRSLSYKLLTGLPLQDYEATVTVEPVTDGSLLTWAGSFVPINAVQSAGGAAALRAALGGFCVSIGRYVSRDDGDPDQSVHESSDEPTE
ncbi:MAG: SRPBCC family protein [Microthrixaceae bacterium]|nr:SRPBCC family protein [Microthrixaceae bacterium]